MSYVIDANVLMSALISGKPFYKITFEALEPIIPDFALIEIDKYKERITAKSKFNDDEMRSFTLNLFQRLTVLPNYYLTEESLLTAERLIDTVDPKDISYLALAIQTNSILLTRDRPIYLAARQKGFRRIMLFDDFLQAFL